MSAKNGFLTPEIGTTVARVRARFAGWFDLLERSNRVAMTLLPKLQAPTNDHQKVLEGAMYGRAVQALQAGTLLVERGMAADARTALRNAAETAIFQLKMALDPSFGDALVENYDYHQRKEANALLADTGISAHLSKEQLEKLREVVAEIDARYPTQRPRTINVAARAAETEAWVLYPTIFQPTSNDAAHTSIKSLGRHFVERKDEGHRFHFGPQLEDAENTLAGLANVYLFVLATAQESFKIVDHEKEVKELHALFRRVAGLEDVGVNPRD